MNGFVLIDGTWQKIISEAWLNEIIYVELNKDLTVKKYITRLSLCQGIRKSMKHKPKLL